MNHTFIDFIISKSIKNYGLLKDSQIRTTEELTEIMLDISKYQILGSLPGCPVYVQEPLERACKKTHVKRPMMYSDFNQYPITAASTDVFNSQHPEDKARPMIRVNPMIFLIHPPNYLEAILAHELGHIHYKHSEKASAFLEKFGINATSPMSQTVDDEDIQFPEEHREEISKRFHKNEFQADKFAARYGYGNDLIAALKAYSTDLDEDSLTHPSHNARAKAVSLVVPKVKEEEHRQNDPQCVHDNRL